MPYALAMTDESVCATVPDITARNGSLAHLNLVVPHVDQSTNSRPFLG